jgi:hypothetical protein
MRIHEQKGFTRGEIVDGSSKIKAREVANVEVQTQMAKIQQTFGSIAPGNDG